MEVNPAHLEDIRDRIKHLCEEMDTTRVDIAKISTDLAWLKKSWWIVASASVGATVTTLLNLVLR